VQKGSDRVDLVPDAALGTLRLLNGNGSVPRTVREWFDANGVLKNGSPEDAAAALERLRLAAFPELRVSQEIAPWLEARRRVEERKQLRRDYELRVQSGDWFAHETKVPLFPYQRSMDRPNGVAAHEWAPAKPFAYRWWRCTGSARRSATW
jgi:hypothetical protein